MCVGVCIYVCLCVSVCERERKKERERLCYVHLLTTVADVGCSFHKNCSAKKYE